jgi:hypothetical protein
MTPLFKTIWAIYWIAALVYVLYAGTESGLGAYLFKLELDIIGAGEEVLTGLLTFGILLMPLWAITRILGKLSPSLVWTPADIANRPERSPAGRMNRPVRSLSWKAVLGFTAIPILVGAVLLPVIYYTEQRDRQEKVYAIDLTAGVADLPKGARFVELTGLMAQTYTLTFKSTFNSSTVSHELFAPIIGHEWTPADPVRYFVRAKSYDDPAGNVQWPRAYGKKDLAQFYGRINTSLPAYVEAEYRSKGLKLDPSYSVIAWEDRPDRGPDRRLDQQGSPPFEDAELYSGICMLFAVPLFLTMFLAKIMIVRMRKKQHSPS